MNNNTSLNIRINSDLKKDAENLFKSLEMSLSTGISVMLRQAVNYGGIPFNLKADYIPDEINLEKMNDEEAIQFFYEIFKEGQKGVFLDAAETFAEFKVKNNIQ